PLAPASASTPRVLRTTWSRLTFPAVHVTARRSSVGWREASVSARASSTPVSTSRITGIGVLWRSLTGHHRLGVLLEIVRLGEHAHLDVIEDAAGQGERGREAVAEGAHRDRSEEHTSE